ncbi:MAG: nuclear transport factor 2 family protein [Acidobacteriia bacterium]|nr:nuclear transport factor 2 family protein [Terriglobia bacterium]
MKRFGAIYLVMGILAAGAIAVMTGQPVAAAEEEQAVLQVDHALVEALGKADSAAAGALLDDNFEWTDTAGKTQNKAEALQNITALAKDSEGDTDLKTHSYSELVIIFGFHHDARFTRIWVKRQAGWRALIYLDTLRPKQAPATAPPAASIGNPGDCENPCRILPFTPTTPADKAVIAEWQKTKMDEWHPDASDWATHIADEFLIINDRAERNKEQRVALARKWQEAGISMPGDPILSMTMSDFGDAVVMISRHAPYNGGKPYYNARVFVHRDGHWLIAWSQQTTIQDAPAVPAVSDK